MYRSVHTAHCADHIIISILQVDIVDGFVLIYEFHCLAFYKNFLACLTCLWSCLHTDTDIKSSGVVGNSYVNSNIFTQICQSSLFFIGHCKELSTTCNTITEGNNNV